MKLFAVIRTHGAAWKPSARLEDQEDWDAHASFMDALEQDGFVALAGPLEGTPDVLLIVRAKTSKEVMDRLQADPWPSRDLLRTSRIAPWTLRLGSIP